MPSDAYTPPPGQEREVPSARGRISSSIGRVLRETYRIVEPLDEGGMGKVFAAEHVRLHRRVAVKFLARHLAGDHNALARFQREAEIISQLHHPHIVHILDFDATPEGEPFIVMEFLHGESLADRLDRGRILPVDAVVRIVSQMASGLQLAHTTGVVHRDLKPANVFLLSMPDDSYFAKLLDFGISKPAAGSARVTREFDVLGTPDYMAPEQARGRAAVVDHRADQFALAVMAYEMISGRLPFQGDTVASVLQAVVNDDPPPLTEVAPLVRPAMTPVVVRALSKDPLDRYPTIAEFASALAESAGAPMTLPPYSHAPLAFSRPVAMSPDLRRAETERDMVAVNPTCVSHARGAASVPADAAARAVSARPTGQVYSFRPGMEEEGSSDEEEVVQGVRRELDRVRRSLAFSERDEAYEAAHAVMSLAFADGPARARQLVRGSAEVLEALFERRVRGSKGLIVLRHVPGPHDEVITHNQVYLLTRLEEQSTLDDALDLSPLSRLETLWLLACSLDTGAIEVA
jgi:serine/threonine protein kinase